MYIVFIDKNSPILTKQHIMNSLDNTNSYCLQGISSQQKSLQPSDNLDIKTIWQIPGLSAVTSVLEEVLRWPTRVGIFLVLARKTDNEFMFFSMCAY